MSRRLIRALSTVHQCHANIQPRYRNDVASASICVRESYLWRIAEDRWGQTRRFDPLPATSGQPRTTDIIRPSRLVRFVPKAEVATWLHLVSKSAMSSPMPGVSQTGPGAEISAVSVVAWQLAYRT